MNKNFSDFLKTLTEEQISDICKNANNIVASYKEENRTSDINLGLELGSQIGLINIQITLGLLKLYHEWLNS